MSPESYKRPESVLVVVYTRGGEVLLLRRRRPAWFWQSVTGSLDWGESACHAALRELREETGLNGAGRLVDCHRDLCFPIVPPWRARYSPAHWYNTEHWFALCLDSRRTITLRVSEHREYRWLPLSSAVRRASSWTNRNALALLLNHGLCR
ncbi:MAG: dihydroneopterin triphosphate diphosphatase [Pseudomonadota bacterium]